MASTHKKRGVAAAVVGLAASVLTAAALTTGALGAFTAQILNDTNTAGTGTLTMREESGANTCDSTDGTTIDGNSATCTDINKYGGDLTMSPTGDPVQTTVVITNTGTIDADEFTLTAGACTQADNGTVNGSATDFCSVLLVTITRGGSQVYSGTAAGLASQELTLTTLGAGETATFIFSTSIDDAAGNEYQGLRASQPLTWKFTA